MSQLLVVLCTPSAAVINFGKNCGISLSPGSRTWYLFSLAGCMAGWSALGGGEWRTIGENIRLRENFKSKLISHSQLCAKNSELAATHRQQHSAESAAMH